MIMPGGIDGVETIRRILEIDSQMLCAVGTAYTDHSPNRLGTLFSRQYDWLYFNKPFSQEELEQTAYHLVTAWNQRRREDAVGRVGGDEFAVILRQASTQSAVQTAQKIMTAIGLTAPLDGEKRHNISASAGIVMFPRSGTKSSELLTSADLAVNKAKKSTGYRYHLFTEEDEVQLRQDMQERVLWRARIEQALAEDEFVLYYQPIMDVQERTVSHYEALVRLREVDGRIIGPNAFIEIAESEGLIRELDKTIVRKTVSQLGTLVVEGRPVHISVNLSPQAIADDELITELEEILATHEVNPANLILEITERLAVADLARSQRPSRHRVAFLVESMAIAAGSAGSQPLPQGRGCIRMKAR